MRSSPLLQILGALASTTAWASPHYSYVGQPDAKVYFGHIAYCDLREDEGDPRVLRDGRPGDRAVPNTPLLPGDTIVTGVGRRCEAQFDTGTVVRLDGATRLRVETILAPALSANAGVTNFQLAEGRIEVRYHQYDKSEVFQVLTTTTAVKLRETTVVTIEVDAFGSTGVEARNGSVKVLFAGAAGKSGKQTVRAGRSTVFGAGHARSSAAPARTATLGEFQKWSEARDTASLSSSPRTEGDLEEPLRSSPPAVRDFAARSAAWGAWVSSDVYGSVWRPNENDRPGWSPYLEGRWMPIRGDWFWVADEPWGWVPYHLGYWTRLKRQGWVWVPASWFAPAWVRWTRDPMLTTWRPLDFWDFYPDETAYAWFGSETGVDTPLPAPRPPGHAVPRRPPPPGPEVPFPPDKARPREVRRVEERLRHSGGASAAALREEADAVRRNVVVLGATEQPSGTRPEIASRARMEGTQGPVLEPPKAAASATPTVPTFTPLVGEVTRPRLRDWNPDVQAARSLGGRIYYSSRDNAVRCSSCREPLVRSGSDASYSAGGSGSGSASPAGSGSSSTTAPMAPASAPPAGGQGGGREAGARREN
jgi:hypothetical protein